MTTLTLSKIADNYPALSEEDEIALAKDYKLNNNLKAAERLVLSYMPLVFKYVNRYVNYGLPREDLEMEGVVGLMTAVKRFDYTRGVRLATFAVNYIKERISAFVLKNYNIINIGTTKSDRKLFFNRTTVNNSDTAADDLEVTQKQLEHFEEKLNGANGLVSIDNEESILQLPSHFKTPHESLEERDEQRQVESLKAAVASLDERTRYIITCRYLQDPPKTFKELGIELGISTQRVEQIERKCVKELKIKLNGV